MDELIKDLTGRIYLIEDRSKRLAAYKLWAWNAAKSISPSNEGIITVMHVKRELETDFPFNESIEETN